MLSLPRSFFQLSFAGLLLSVLKIFVGLSNDFRLLHLRFDASHARFCLDFVIVRKLILFFLLMLSCSVFAETLPAQLTSGAENCTSITSWNGYPVTGQSLGENPDQWSGTSCHIIRNGNWTWTTYTFESYSCPSGILSGTSCLNVPACISPQVRSSLDPYACIANPCTSGTVKDLTYLRPSGSALTIYMGQGPSIVDAGCNYSCSDVSKATLSNASGNYSTFSCTATGVQNATSTSTPAPTGMIASTSTATNQTCNTVSNKNVCTGGDIPAGCSYINGVKTCGTALDTATVDSIPIKATDAKNCVVSGGKTLCITPSANTSTNNLTANSNGSLQGLQFENGVKTTSSTVTTANPDGSTSTTITETTNIYGQSDGVTTTNCITAGNCTSTKTGGSNPQADVAASAAKAECSKPENVNTLGCIDSTKTVSPTPDAITNTAVSASLNVGSYDAGSCPPDQSINTSRGNFTFSNAPICSLASSTKPFAVALAFLTAGLLVLSPIK